MQLEIVPKESTLLPLLWKIFDCFDSVQGTGIKWLLQSYAFSQSLVFAWLFLRLKNCKLSQDPSDVQQKTKSEHRCDYPFSPRYTNSPNTTLTLCSKQRSLHHQGLTFYRVIYQVHTPVALREDPPVRLRAVSDRKDVQGSLEASQEHTGDR